jgi:hypothetical protein
MVDGKDLARIIAQRKCGVPVLKERRERKML